MVTHNYIVAFELELKKVNPNGPSLAFSVGSSVSQVLSYEIPSSLDIPEDRSELVDISSGTTL
jgi:hypothetical protein